MVHVATSVDAAFDAVALFAAGNEIFFSKSLLVQNEVISLTQLTIDRGSKE